MVSSPMTNIFYGWVIVAGVSVILSLQWGCIDTYGIFLTELHSDLGWTKTAISGAYSLFSIISCSLSILTGSLNDRYGPRLILMISIIVIGTGYVLMSTLSAIWQLYVFYGVIAAIGASFGWVPAISTVSRWFTKKRGMALGIAQAGAGIGSFIMPPLSQFLILKFGWRVSYLILSGFLFVIGIPASRLMRPNPSKKGLYPDGMEDSIENKESANSMPGIVDFSFRQALRTRQFWLLFIMYATAALPIGMLVHLKAYMLEFGISEMTAATVIGIRSAAFVIGALVISRLSDRIGKKVPLFICFLVMTVTMLWLIRATQPWEFYLFSIISGFTWGSLTLFPAIAADWFGTKFHGSIYGAFEIGFGIAGGVAPLLAGYIFDTRGNYELAIIIMATGLFIAMGLSCVISSPQEQAGFR